MPAAGERPVNSSLTPMMNSSLNPKKKRDPTGQDVTPTSLSQIRVHPSVVAFRKKYKQKTRPCCHPIARLMVTGAKCIDARRTIQAGRVL